MNGFAAVFDDLDDPGTGNAARHDLLEILLIALCTVLCGGQTVDMAEFAAAKEEFLREFLTLENGLPSHDTFSRIFRLLDPEQFSGCFGRLWRGLQQSTGLLQLMERSRAVRLTAPAPNQHCTWSARGAATSGWCWRKWRAIPSRTRLLPCPNCWRCCRSRARLSRLMR